VQRGAVGSTVTVGMRPTLGDYRVDAKPRTRRGSRLPVPPGRGRPYIGIYTLKRPAALDMSRQVAQAYR
jgi:hypothetical protein